MRIFRVMRPKGLPSPILVRRAYEDGYGFRLHIETVVDGEIVCAEPEGLEMSCTEESDAYTAYLLESIPAQRVLDRVRRAAHKLRETGVRFGPEFAKHWA